MKPRIFAYGPTVYLLVLLFDSAIGLSVSSAVAEEPLSRSVQESADTRTPPRTYSTGPRGASHDVPQLGNAGIDAPTSIFNDRLRAFRFRLENTFAGMETAEEFLIIYRHDDRPAILGAYPDAESNALVVVGPPDAEQAIRETLATWLVQSFGPADGSLKIKRRGLAFDRRRLIENIANLEIEMVQVQEHEASKTKVEQLRARVAAFAAELAAVERQIEVADRYLQKLKKLDHAD